MLRGGVIGFGNVGQNLSQYINSRSDRAEIIAACDCMPDKLQRAETEFGLRATASVDELCGWDLDFALVVSSNHAHRDHVLAAAEQGCHIFCEKPISISLADAADMVAAVEAAGVQTVVNYSMRHQKWVQVLKSLIDNGQLGEILSISYEKSRAWGFHAAGRPHPAVAYPEQSGGWIVHHMCHQLDLLYFLFGDFDTFHCTSKTTCPDGRSEELIFANGQLGNGVMFHLSDTVARLPYSHLVVHGSRASISLQGDGNVTVGRLREENAGADNYMTFENGWILDKVSPQPHAGIEHFLDCIEGKAEPAATLESSIESLLVATLMKENMNSGETVRVGNFRDRVCAEVPV